MVVRRSFFEDFTGESVVIISCPIELVVDKRLKYLSGTVSSSSMPDSRPDGCNQNASLLSM